MKNYKQILIKPFLYNGYIKNKKSCNQIAKEVGCRFETIRRYLIKYYIPRRTISEAGLLLNKKGRKAPGYIDGRTNKIHYCINCGKEVINIYAMRCKSCEGKLRFRDKKYREKFLKASLEAKVLSPNKPEKVLIKLLNEILPNEYKFVGNGKIFIARFVPDFFNINNKKKLIELYGDYWHNLKDSQKKDKIRINTFEKYGYKTLIIWEKELKDLSKVKEKILQFNK